MFLTGQVKPSRLTATKGEKYHLDMARHCVGVGYYDRRHTDWLKKIALNKRFYKGDQFVKDEDLSAFFLSATGDATTRIKMVFNIIRPMVEQYRGSSINMDFNGQVYAVGSQAYSRKIKRYERLDFYDDLARELPDQLSKAITDRLPVGRSKAETQKNFEDIDVDDVVETFNSFLSNLKKRNRLESYKLPFAQSMAFSGNVTNYPYEHHGHWAFRHVQSENFFWDRSAREYDLRDASFWGERWDVDNATIFETWQDMQQSDRLAIDNYDMNNADIYYNQGNPGEATSSGVDMVKRGKTPVFRVIWVDTEEFEYGYVKDAYGEPYMDRINYTYEDEDKPRFTMEDVIPLEQLPAEKKKRIGKKKTRKMKVDILRFCEFIPNEYTGVYKTNNGGDYNDIVLKFGIFEGCERDPLSPFNILPPYITNFWSYVDGEALSPIDDSIDPQRLINRFISISENRINRSSSDFIAYDEDALPGEDGAEKTMLRDIAQGNPVRLRTRGRGLPNAVMNVQSNISNSTFSMFNMVNSIVGFNQHTTGINSEMNGQASGGSEQLVGVTEALIQRGSILQQPFYNAISEVHLGLFNSMLTRGKRIYANNGTELYDMVGKEGAQIIKITKSMAMEDMACDIRRDAGDPILKQAANQTLDILADKGFIDKGTYATLYGRSTPESIGVALRRIAKEEAMAARAQSEQEAGLMQQVANEEATQQAKQQNLQAITMQREDQKMAAEHKNKIDQVVAKGLINAMNKK